MSMIEHDPNDIEVSGPDSQNEGRHSGQDSNSNQRIDRPYSDAGNLYEIPRVRSDDPPMREWWTDEPQQDGGAQNNG